MDQDTFAAALLDALPEALGLVEGTCLRWGNAAMAALLKRGALELPGLPLRELFGPADFARLEQGQLQGAAAPAPSPPLVLQLLRPEAGVPVTSEVEALRVAGRPRLLWRLQPHEAAPLPAPAPSSLLGQLAYALVGAPSLGLLLCGGRGEVMLANPAATHILGRPAAELQRAGDWLALLAPERAPRLALREALEAGLAARREFSGALRLRRPSGEHRSLRFHCQPLGGGPALLVLLDDATEVLRDSLLCSQLVALNPLPLGVVDERGTLRYANSAFLRTVAPETRAFVPGLYLPGEPSWQRSGLADWLVGLLRLPGEEIPAQPSFELHDPGDPQQNVSLRGLVLGDDGPQREILLLGDDRSEQRQLEAQLRRAVATEALGTLAGGLAHDLSNTLSAIAGFAAALAQAGPASPTFLDDLQAISELSTQGAGLSRQLMTLGREDAGLRRLQPNRVILSSARLLRHTLPETVRLELELADDLPEVLAAEGSLQQCLLNLCLNARDAMPGGGRISLRSQRLPAVGPKPARVRIDVRDSGQGIADQDLPRVFEPFFTTRARGTGLGLSMVRRTVARLGGQVLVESRPGHGAVFSLVLPAASEQAQAAEAATPDVLPRGSESVLVVEDSQGLRQALERLLGTAGYRVHGVGDGQEACEFLLRERVAVDLAVVDLGLPDGSGPGLAERLTSLRPGLKILLSSGHRDHLRPEARAANRGRPFLAKPYGARALLQAVRAALGGSAEAQ